MKSPVRVEQLTPVNRCTEDIDLSLSIPSRVLGSRTTGHRTGYQCR